MKINKKEWSQEFLRRDLFQKPLIIFGAGQLGSKINRILAEENIKVACFVDETPEKIGTFIDGTPVISLEEAIEQYKTHTWLISIFLPNHSFESTKNKLNSLGIKSCISFYTALRAYPSHLPMYFFDTLNTIDFESVKNLRNKLADDLSKTVLDEFLELKINGKFSFTKVSEPYDFELLSLNNSIFIDAGAFDGDTIKNIYESGNLEDISKYIAIEPDLTNYQKLCFLKESLPAKYKAKIETHNCALWRTKGEVQFLATSSTASQISDDHNSQKVPCVSIDSLAISEMNKSNICIKMDVEGVEKEAIKGSTKTIKKYKPSLILSVYHKPNDITEIYNIVSSIRSDYRFYLRQHGYDGADLMLYCI